LSDEESCGPLTRMQACCCFSLHSC